MRRKDKRKFISFVNKQLLPTTDSAKKIRGDIFTPISLIDGNYNSSEYGLSDESTKTESSILESLPTISSLSQPLEDAQLQAVIADSVYDSQPTQSSVGQTLEDAPLQSLLLESEYDSQLTHPGIDMRTRLNKDTPSISDDIDSYTNKYCYRQQGKDGRFTRGDRKGQLKPGWSCKITEDSSKMDDSYCTYDQGKCRPNCYYHEGKQHKCNEVRDEPHQDNIEKCVYENGCKTLLTKKNHEKWLKKQEGKLGGSSNNNIKQYYKEHQGQLKNSYSKILDTIPLNRQDYNVIKGLISRYNILLGGMDKSLFGNIVDTMGSYTQTRNLAKYGIIPDIQSIPNTIKSILYKKLI